MLVNEMNSDVKKAYYFLQNYCKENNINDISELFSKSTLVENTYQSDWDWSVKDEMDQGLSEEEAIEKTEKWLLSMNNEELFYDRISTYNQHVLILDKAEELGLELDEELDR